MTILVYADISNRMPNDAYVLAFDKDGDGVVTTGSAGQDKDHIDACIATAEAHAQGYLKDAFPAGLDQGTGVDAELRAALVMMAIFEAMRYSPLASGDNKSPYRQGWEDALALLDKIKKGVLRNIITAAGAQSAFNPRVNNTTADDGAATNQWQRSADRKIRTLF